MTTEVLKFSTTSSFSFNFKRDSSINNYMVPNDIINKFEVEKIISETVEEIIEKKINESSSKEEAFYIIDLSKVIKKYKQWIVKLPRVKPFYGNI